MMVDPHHTLALTRAGFTEAQAGALTTAIDRSATRAVDDLRRDLERWHVALSLYLLVQIGIVLLAFLMLQALRDPIRGRLADYDVGARQARSDGETVAVACVPVLKAPSIATSRGASAPARGAA